MTIGGLIFTMFLLTLVGLYIYAIMEKFKYYKDSPAENKKVNFESPHEVGHKLWMLNLKTLEMNQISQEYINTYGHEKDCIYCSALNEKNAIKHFSRMVPGKFEKI